RGRCGAPRRRRRGRLDRNPVDRPVQGRLRHHRCFRDRRGGRSARLRLSRGAGGAGHHCQCAQRHAGRRFHQIYSLCSGTHRACEPDQHLRHRLCAAGRSRQHLPFARHRGDRGAAEGASRDGRGRAAGAGQRSHPDSQGLISQQFASLDFRHVMPGLSSGVHAFLSGQLITCMAGQAPAMPRNLPQRFHFRFAFAFCCDLIEIESEIAEVKATRRGKRSLDRIFDLAIIGGGVNGCGIARDAAGRGNSVFLCEMNDLASGTASWSTKLVHGGLRYLEYYEFRLVREALIEREILWQIAPHIIRPLRFVLPHHAGLRPAWLLRLGLFLYDHIGGRHLLPPTRSVDLTRDEVGRPLIPNRYTKGFEYSDCFVDDARLVVLTARDAADRGAEIRTRTRAVEIRPTDGIWQVTVEDASSGERSTVQARALVNAGGPWVEQVLASGAGVNAKAKVRLVQGSHIVVPKLYAHDRAYMFQNSDGRIVFVIPYQDDFTLIGTTDRDYDGDPAKVKASAKEIQYLCDSVSEYLAKPVKPGDVVWTYAGVRPLYDDGANEAKAATREYVLELDKPGGAPLLS